MKIINALDPELIQKYPSFYHAYSPKWEKLFVWDAIQLIDILKCDVLVTVIIDLNLSGRKVRAYSKNEYTSNDIKKSMKDILVYDTHDVSLTFEICESWGLTTALIFRGQKHGKKFARISITSMEEILI